MNYNLIVVLLTTLHTTSALRSEPCRNLFQGFLSRQSGQLETILQTMLNYEDVDFQKDWEITINFTQYVTLDMEIVLGGEIPRHAGLPDKIRLSPTRISATDGKQSFTARGSWETENFADFRLVSIHIAMNLTFTGDFIDILNIKLNNETLCFGDEGCGVRDNSVPLVMRGEATQPGDWPWLAAIFMRSKYNLGEFFCGGSLVSAKHVITAAHCIRSKGKNFKQAEDLVVHLGKHELLSANMETGHISGVSNVIIHPDWQKDGVIRSRDADIAILELRNAVTFNEHVRPVCIGSHVVSSLPEGTVVGWGLDEALQISSEPRSVRMPVVTQDDCRNSDNRFINLTSDRTFCAGNKNGSGPCVGDSGGGFYVQEILPGSTPRFTLHGIVSRSLRTKNEEDKGICDLSQFVIFTFITPYLDWIRSYLGIWRYNWVNFRDSGSSNSKEVSPTKQLLERTRAQLTVCQGNVSVLHKEIQLQQQNILLQTNLTAHQLEIQHARNCDNRIALNRQNLEQELMMKHNRVCEKRMEEINVTKENVIMQLRLENKKLYCDLLKARAPVKLNGNFYFISNGEMTWPAARAACIELGLDLVSIENEFENQALINYFKSKNIDNFNVWIGGTDSQNQGLYRWVATNKPFVYVNWREGEPNDAGGTEDCAEFTVYNGGQWNDLSCTLNQRSFICELQNQDCL